VTRYTHQGWCGFQPYTGTECFFDRIEQQNERDERHVERRHFGEAEQAEARAFLRNGWLGEIDLGGIMAQPDRDLQREGNG
jgi:hypothetical protein